MFTVRILSALTMLQLQVVPAFAAATSENTSERSSDRSSGEMLSALAASGVTAVDGPLTYVACTSDAELNVRDESLDKVLFTAHRFEAVKPVQSFGTDKHEQTINGQTYTFIKVQFPENEASQNIGWVAESFVRLKSQCPGFTSVVTAPLEAFAAGWTFPTAKRPSDSYKTGQRKFKASRSGGRLHAAADLYRNTGDSAVAVSAGTIIRDRYYFYEGTYALEVRHTGGKVARYGEITGKAATGVSVNKTVQVGQTVGYIGKVNSGCCAPMLHFELYSGAASGALTQTGNSFGRRKDLVDPTSYLVDWEKTKFGTSY